MTAENQNTPSVVYTKKDGLLAAAVTVIFMFAFDGLMKSELALGAACIILSLTAVTAVYLRFSGFRQSKIWYLPVMTALLAVSLVLTSNFFVRFLVTGFTVIIYCVWVLTACGNGCAGASGSLLPYDILKAVFVMPLCNLGRLFGAAASLCKGKKAGKAVFYAFMGLLAAVLPTAAVAVLLSGADNSFGEIISGIEFNPGDWFARAIVCVLTAAPVYGCVSGNALRACSGTLTYEKCVRNSEKCRVLPRAFVYAAVTPVLLLYVLFFVLMFRYFTAAFSSSISGAETYADFARQGFFELCAVSVINSFIMTAVTSFTKRKDGEKTVGTRIYASLYAVSTLALIVIALSKMCLYISKFGMTRLRVYTTFFMLLLFILFAAALARQIWQRFSFMKTAAAAVCVFALVFAFCRPDAVIASYNVSAYLDGRLETVDLDELSRLSYDAVPNIARLTDADDSEVAHTASAIVKRKSAAAKNGGAADFNFVKYQVSRME